MNDLHIDNMDEETKSGPPNSIEVRKPNPFRRMAVYAIVLIIVFLLGFVPMWISARRSENSLSEVQQQLKSANMQNSIASAVIDARLAKFEPARREASEFFTALSTEINGGRDSSLSSAQQNALQPFLAQRDEIITLLARSDGTAVDRLTEIYSKFRSIVSGGSDQVSPK